MAWWRHLRAWIILPFNVIVFIPLLLIWQKDGVFWWWGTSGWTRLLLMGLVCIALLMGTLLFIGAIRLLAHHGKGTLAPWDPTRRLVVVGIYRYVRNPMMSGVFCLLFAEAIVFGEVDLALWWLLFVLGNLVFIPLFEEPPLRRRFGESYREYCRHVGRWIPRRTPWQGLETQDRNRETERA